MIEITYAGFGLDYSLTADRQHLKACISPDRFFPCPTLSGAGCKQLQVCLLRAAGWWPLSSPNVQPGVCSPVAVATHSLASGLSQSINFYIMSYFIIVSAHFGFLSPGTQLYWWNVPSWGVVSGISFYFCSVNNCGRGTAKGWLELLLLMLLKLFLTSLFQSEMVQFMPTVKIRD